jgi:hypothetical protein
MAAPKTAPAPVEIDTATLANKALRPANIRIGGTVFEAHCPKDAVLARIHREGSDSIEVILGLISAMIGKANGEKVAAMLDDEDCDDVSIYTLSALTRYLMEDEAGPQWGKALLDGLKSLGSGETPRTVPVKKAASSRKAAPRAAKRTPARR